MDILNEGKRPAHKEIPQKDEKKEELKSGNDIFDFLSTTPTVSTSTTHTVKASENSTGIGNLEDIFSSISSTSQSQNQKLTQKSFKRKRKVQLLLIVLFVNFPFQKINIF